jgi:hypothetical protein
MWQKRPLLVERMDIGILPAVNIILSAVHGLLLPGDMAASGVSADTHGSSL